MESKILIFLLISIKVAVIDCWQPQYRCDYQYYREISAFYKLHDMPTDWRTARLKCRLEGSELAVPTSQEVMNVLKNIVSSKIEPNSIFIGIHGLYSPGDFQSVNGTPLFKIIHKWAENQPDNKNGKENCLVLNHDGVMEDVPCDDHHPFICYKKASKEMSMTECGTDDTEYTMGRKTSSCYKFHPEARDWSHASMVCTAEGGYLAIINSPQEAQLMEDLFYYPDTEDNNTSEYVAANIGVLFEDEEWMTVQGEPLLVAGYATFAPTDPNNDADPAETPEPPLLCAGVNPAGQLVATNCQQKYPFICEKHPKSLTCDGRSTLSH